MTALKVNGKDMRDNQYMFKAKIVELIMTIAEGLNQQTLVVVMVQLQRVYDVQTEYCEGDSAHPFLEEVVSVQASFLERIGRYDQAYLKWENFLNI
jgi:peptide methionine sulfoxide reductase MsrA